MKENSQNLKIEKTQMCKPGDIDRRWFVVDASGMILGRLATEIANVLRGKHRIDYTPHTDCGEGVIVINAEKICVTGNKEAQKTYHTYSGYPGGERAIPYRTMKQRKPEYIITHAVKGMVPRTRQGRKQMTRFRVFAGPQHDLQTQKPITLKI